MEPSIESSGISPSSLLRREALSARQQLAMVYSGLFFMGLSLVGFGGLVWWLLNAERMPPYAPVNGGSELMWYVGGYFPAVALLCAAIACAVIGYAMLSAAGAAGREVIPRRDYALLSALVAEEKEKGIDLYVRLNSLSGLTGFFTKIGITGLPLATIGLSLIFTLLGLSAGANAKLLDLANLTLGAFLGSYVQRQAGARAPRSGGDNPAP